MITISIENIDEYRTGSYPDCTSLIWKAGPLDSLVLSHFPNLIRLDCGGNELATLAGGFSPSPRVGNQTSSNRLQYYLSSNSIADAQKIEHLSV